MPNSTSICQANLLLVLKIQLHMKSLAAADLCSVELVIVVKEYFEL